MTNNTELTAITAATITGTDGNTWTLELRPQISPDYGLRYSIFVAESGDDTETSGAWYGANTYSDDDNELHLTDAHQQMAYNSAIQSLQAAWGEGWELEMAQN
jgi:hypothetical protein